MVYVPHDGHNRWTGLEVFWIVHHFSKDLIREILLGLYFHIQLSADDLGDFIFNALGERCHDAQPHEPFDQLSAADRQLFCQILHSDGLRQGEYLLFHLRLLGPVVSPAPGLVAPVFLTLLRAEVLFNFFVPRTPLHFALAGSVVIVDLLHGQVHHIVLWAIMLPDHIRDLLINGTHMVADISPQFNEEVHEDFTL